MMRLKVSCCIFLITCASIPLASETPRQEDGIAPILSTIQTELGLVSASTKEAIRLQKEAALLQGAALATTFDILAHEKLQAATFDKTIEALRLEQSSAQRNAWWGTGILGALLMVLILSLWLPLKKRIPLFGAPPPSDKENDGPLNEQIQIPINAPQLPPEEPEANMDTLRSSPPVILNIQIEKAVPLFYEDEVSYEPITDPLSNDRSILLAQAEKIRQERLESINNPQQQNQIPLINLLVRYPNASGGNRSSIKDKIIRGKIDSLRELSRR